MNRPTISAIVLTHDDESIVARCLKSVAWCNEIIIVDDDSIDTTVAVARKHGAHVFKRALNDDFAAQRNFGLKQTKNDWVLFVDSDEVVSTKLAKEIKQKISFNDKECAGYFLRRTDFLWGRELKHGETKSVQLLRLAQRNAGVWNRAVHETWEIDGAVVTLQEPLLHYPHQTIAEFLTDINRYTTINARVFKAQGIGTSWFAIFTYPTVKFIYNYIIRGGFLDGTAGFIIAVLMSFHSFLTRAKLYFLINDQQNHI